MAGETGVSVCVCVDTFIDRCDFNPGLALLKGGSPLEYQSVLTCQQSDALVELDN